MNFDCFILNMIIEIKNDTCIIKTYTEYNFHILSKEDQTGCVKFSNGDKAWYKEGKLHREDGPAVEFANGSKEWYKENKLHREDGPAVEYANGNKEYWLNSRYLYYRDWYIIVNNLEKFK